MEHRKIKGKTEIYSLPSISKLNDTHMEELDSVQKFIEVKGWFIVQISEKRDSSSRQ